MFNKEINSKTVQIKKVNFRSWKKGKVWLYASATVLSVIGIGATTTEVHADVTTTAPTTAVSTPQTKISAAATPVSAKTSENVSASSTTAAPAANSTIVTPRLSAKNLTINKDDSFIPVDSFLGGTDSTGQAVKLSQVTESDTVNTSTPGVYGVEYSFVDERTNQTVSAHASITVKDDSSNSVVSDLPNKIASPDSESGTSAQADSAVAGSSVVNSETTIDANMSLSSAANQLSSYAQTDAGKAAVSQANVVINSAVANLSAAASLASDPQVLQFKTALSSAVANNETGIAKSLVAAFGATEKGSALNSLAAVSNQMPSDADVKTLNSLTAGLTSTATADSSAAIAASAASSYMSTSEGQALIEQANSVASDASSASQAAVKAFASTADGKAMLSALSSYAAGSQFSAFNTEMSSAVAAKDTTLVSSLASSFFATPVGSQFATDMAAYEATNSYKTMSNAIAAAQDEAAKKLQASITLASQSLAGTGLSNSGILGGITGGVWNAVSWLAQHINPVAIIPNLTRFGQWGEFGESLLGAVVGSVFYGTIGTATAGLTANLISVLPVTVCNTIVGIVPILDWWATTSQWYSLGWIGGIAGWFGGAVSSAAGAYYGATMAPGLATSDGHVDNVVGGVAIGSTIGAMVGESVSDWLFSYPVAHLVWGIPGALSLIAGTIGTIADVINPLSALVMTWFTPLTDTMATFRGARRGALIGGLLGGAIGAIAQATGLKLNLPAASQLVKDIAALPGLSDLLSTIKTVTEKAGTIVTKSVTVAREATYLPVDGLTSATDSAGATVPLSKISTQGTVNTDMPGIYVVNYQYQDTSNNNQVVNGYSVVTVQE